MFVKKKKVSVGILISVVIIVGFILSGLFFCLSFYSFFKKDVESVSELQWLMTHFCVILLMKSQSRECLRISWIESRNI